MAAWGGDANDERDNQRLEGLGKKITIFLRHCEQPWMNERVQKQLFLNPTIYTLDPEGNHKITR